MDEVVIASPTRAEVRAGVVPPRASRLAVMAFFFVAGAGMGSWFPRIPVVEQTLGLSHGELGVALVGPAVGALATMPTTGWLIARWGSRAVTTAAAVLLCLVLPLPVLAPTLWALIAVLVALGAANGALDVSMNVQAVAVERRYRRPIMSSFHAVYSVGGLIGAVVAGAVAGAGIAAPPHLAGVGLALAILAAVASRRLLPGKAVATGEGPAFARPTRPLLGLGVVAFCVLVGEGAMADWSAVYLGTTLGTSAAFAAAGYAAFACAMVGGRVAGDGLTARLGPVRVIRLGGLLVALGLGAGLLAGVPWSGLLGFACVGAGLSCAFPVLLSAAGRTPGLATGAAIAAVATVGYAGFLVGPPVIGLVAELIGLRSGLGIVVLVGLAMVLLANAVARPSAADQEATGDVGVPVAARPETG